MNFFKAGKRFTGLFSGVVAGFLLTTSGQNANAALTNCDTFSQLACLTAAPAKKQKLNRGFRTKSRFKRKLRHSYKHRRQNRRVILPHVQTHCFPQRLRRLMDQVERHYGKKLVLTSGYRSPRHNRRINGAKRSQHMHCKAVDFQIRGVNKYSLARYVKTLPSVGGVGSYCGSSSIHMDVGPKRSWHWGCGKRKKRSIYAKKRNRSKRHYRKSYRTASYRVKRKTHKKSWSYFNKM